MNTKKTTKRKTLEGTVVSDRMTDTVVVKVDRFVKHPIYEKFIRKSSRIKAHDPGNTATVGDRVVIEETNPISKEKSFRILPTSSEQDAKEEVDADS